MSAASHPRPDPRRSRGRNLRRPERVNLSFRDEVLAMHRQIFKDNQQRINEAVSGYSPAFRRYEREYQRRVATYQQRADIQELDRRVAEADVVYVGDYHTLAQAQRGFIRLLSRVPKSRPVTIALEFVRARQQSYLDAFLQGEIGEDQFLAAMGYDPEHGLGDWSSFRRVFDYARENQLRVVGVDSLGRGPDAPLVNRDHAAARVLSRELRRRPENLIMVLTGELHVAPDHLPQRVHEDLRRHGLVHEPLIVYQNCHEIYWQLAARGKEHDTEVVRVARGEYYLLNTLPIVAQQSFLNALDVDDDAQLEAPEANFIEFARRIADFFALPVGDRIEDVEVTSIVDLSFLKRLRRRGDFSAADIREIERQVLRSESYTIPRANMVYLGNLSVNHAAEEASHFLRSICSGALEPRMLVDAFYARCLEEAVGFLGSKLLNHKRRAVDSRALERRAKNRRLPEHDRVVARLVLKHLRMEAGLRIRGGSSLYECDADTFNEVTHLLGYLLGEKIYYGLLAGELEKTEVRELYFEAFEEDGVALTTYLFYVSRTKGVRVPEGG